MNSIENMRSPRGFLAAIVFLSLLPVAALWQMFFTDGLEIVTHLVLATGSILISLAVFDFKMPVWITWTGCISMAALTAIFLLQAVALLAQNDSLTYLVFQLLGQQLEKCLGLLFIFWCIAMLLLVSRGKTRIFGSIIMSAVVCLQIYTYSLLYLGGTPTEELKLIFLLMFVWLLLESAKKMEQDGAQ